MAKKKKTKEPKDTKINKKTNQLNEKKMSENKVNNKYSNIYKEIIGLFILSLLVLLTAALITYNPADISRGISAIKIKNIMGPVGSVLSHYMILGFGLSSYLLVVAIAGVAFHFFHPIKLRLNLINTIGLIILVPLGAALVQMIIGKVSALGYSAGGILGIWISTYMIKGFSLIGSYIILSCLFIIVMVMSTGISVKSFLNATFKSVNKILVTLVKKLLDMAFWVGNKSKSLIQLIVKKAEEVEKKDKEKKLKDKERFKIITAKNAENEQAISKNETATIKRKEILKAKKITPAKDSAIQQVFDFFSDKHNLQKLMVLPSIDLLNHDEEEKPEIDEEKLRQKADLLERRMKEFGVIGEVVNIRPGPVVTMFEFKPGSGIRINKITNLSDDLAMALEAIKVRIVAPIPGKAVVGIEVPNDERETVYLKDVIGSEQYQDLRKKSLLTLALGKDIEGVPFAADLAKMPHLLVAGATGKGKSVLLNSMICSILMNAIPNDVRLIMVDPKQLEFSLYEGIPHLLLPVVTDAKKAAAALMWLVEEMERRYTLMAEMGVRDIIHYNKGCIRIQEEQKAKAKQEEEGKVQLENDQNESNNKVVVINHIKTQASVIIPDTNENEKVEEKDLHMHLPFIVVIIDELADLMMVASKNVNDCIMRLSQKARASGIHLLFATQRPTVDIVNGVIKSNFPGRISLQVTQKNDSRTILDEGGAESLLGKGDMLYKENDIIRVHGAFVTEIEINKVVNFLKKQGTPDYDESILEGRDIDAEPGDSNEEYDEVYDEAVAYVSERDKISTSRLQRDLRIGYNRASRIIEVMEKEGIVGPANGSKPREVLINPI